MNVLQEVEDYINTFNQYNDINFDIDSIRIEFKKRYKLEKLKSLGVWKKISKNDKKIMARLTANQITSAYKVPNQKYPQSKNTICFSQI